MTRLSSSPLRLSKHLGQHFLVDGRQVRRFVELVQCESDALCIEVGPGQGVTTECLAPQVPRLCAVELDARWIPALRERCAAFPQVTVLHGDILRFEPPPHQPLVVVGAIPYQITSPLLEQLAGWKPRLRRAYLIIQREVAQRLAASPGTSAWGRISCLVQYHFEVRKRWDVPPEAFRPRPRVQSAAVELISRPAPPCRVEDEPFFFALIGRIFQQRRKTLWNALRSWDRRLRSESQLREALDAVHIAPSMRGETLPLADLARLANHLSQQKAGDQ